MRQFVRSHQTVGQALPTSSGHTSHSVDEQLALAGEVIVDDVVQERDVDASGRQVGDDHHVHLLSRELGGVDLPGRGVQLAVDGGDGEVGQPQEDLEVLHMVPSGAEHDRLLVLRDHVLQQVQQDPVPTVRVDLEEGELESLGDLGLGVQADQGGVGQAGLGEVHEELGKSGGEESGLPGVGQSAEDLSQLVSKPHLEQTVGLVKHDVLHAVELEAHLQADVDEPARGGEYHVWVGVYGGELLLYGVTTEDAGEGETCEPSDLFTEPDRLEGQLPGRTQYEGSGSALGRPRLKDRSGEI